MSDRLTREEYEDQRRRLIGDLDDARRALDRATTRVHEIERDVRVLDWQYDHQNDPTA